MYNVEVDGITVKSYPYKIQAFVYCLISGYVYTGFDEWEHCNQFFVLDDDVKIVEVTNAR